MSTEKENRPEGSVKEENQNVSREGGYKSYNQETPYNRYNNDGEQRPYRPRTNYNNEGGGDRPYRPYNNDRPRYNGGDRPAYNNGERPAYNRYNSDERPARPRFTPNGEAGGDSQRSYRPRYEGGDRPQNGGYGREGGFNREGGAQRPYQPRPQGGGYNREGGYNRGGDRPAYNNGDRPMPNRSYGDRPAYNQNRYNNEAGGEQRSYRPRYNEGGYNRDGGARPYRPRYEDNRSYDRTVRPRSADYDPNAKYSLKKRIEYKDLLTDPNEPIRLNKYLANAGVCSRREADEFITSGAVMVNGEVVVELGTKVQRTDEVKFHDDVVSIERKVYVLLNKPKDCVTTSDDPQERRTVMDFVKNACAERIYPVGRLDRNTTGVLLLTNDGDLASKLTHPKFLKKKVYHVFCDKNVTKADLEQIATGITLDDGEIKADEVSYTSDVDRSQVGIEIHSGKNRIVRRIFESLGYRVMKLDRVYFAGLTKKNLRRGDWRHLTEQEVNVLRMGSFE
ncbi:MAG: pseudouridine synthase [Phocaeicola sp.]